MAELTYLEAIRQALLQEMERDDRVILLGEDVGEYGGAFRVTEGLYQRFGPDRVIDTPIAEAGFTHMAMGYAYAGLRPVVEYQFADFISLAFDPIVQYIAKNHYRNNLPTPIVMRAPCGAGVHGGSSHSQSPEAYFCHVPGLKVVIPATPYDAKGLLIAAIRDDNPVIYFEHKYLYRRIKGEVPDEPYTVPLGKADVKRSGRDLTVFSWGWMLHESLQAAEEVAKEGIDVEVVDMRTLLPFDRDTVLASVRKTSKVLIVHEDNKTMGVGAELAAFIAENAFEWLDAPITRLAAPDTPVPYAPHLEEFYLPNARKIADAIRQLAAY